MLRRQSCKADAQAGGRRRRRRRRERAPETTRCVLFRHRHCRLPFSSNAIVLWLTLTTHTLTCARDRIPDGLPRRRHTQTAAMAICYVQKNNSNNNNSKSRLTAFVSRRPYVYISPGRAKVFFWYFAGVHHLKRSLHKFHTSRVCCFQ